MRRHLAVPSSPIDLAVLRIAFFVLVLPEGLSRVPARMADLPEPLRNPPTLASWIYDLLPPDAGLARAGGIVMVLSAVAGLFGWHARWAAAVWAVTATWVIGISNLFGKVDHVHHLVWLALLLAASPCADALSLDALRARRALPEPAVRYGLPIRIWWLLLGGIYFFAGAWKLVRQGPMWASPGNLRPLLYEQWAVADRFVPPLRIDHWPLVLVAVGVGTLLFELGFIVLVFSRFRWLAGVGGVAFHVGTLAFLDISFTSLLVLYVALVPWAATLGLAAPSPGDGRAPPHGRVDRGGRAIAGVGGVLVVGLFMFGVSETTEGWPMACYPTFSYPHDGSRTSLEFEVTDDRGRTEAVSLDQLFEWAPGASRQRLALGLLRLSDADKDRVLREIELPDELVDRATSIAVFRTEHSTDPDDPRQLSRTEIAEVAL